MSDYGRAVREAPSLVENRRYFHTNAETGLALPKAVAYVTEKLREYGLEPVLCGHGVTATVGRPGKTLLLRADMDALPMAEESGLSFACGSGNAAHTCGHDMHAAMLLTAAKLLKEDEESLPGTVKFMFQPAEETFEGAADMIRAGVLRDPVPDAALAIHVAPGKLPIGTYMYNAGGTMMLSVDTFRVTVRGKGAHGAYPHLSVDPINIGVHVHLALQELIARECDPAGANLLTVGQFTAGTAANIIPEECVLRGTVRTDSAATRDKLKRRIKEVSEGTAAVFGGSAEVEFSNGVAPLVCDAALTREMAGYIDELGVPGSAGYGGVSSSASEDFAHIAEAVPSAFFYVSAGFTDGREDYPSHNPKVTFNEDALPVGAAVLVHCAKRWLQNGAKL